MAAAPYAIIETDKQARSSTSATRPLRPRSPPGGVRFIARGGKLVVLEGDPAEAAGRFGVRGPEAAKRWYDSPKQVIDEAAGCDRLLLMRDGPRLPRPSLGAAARRHRRARSGRAFLAVIEAAAR